MPMVLWSAAQSRPENPGGRPHVRSSAIRSSAARRSAGMAAVSLIAPSLERVEIAEKRPEILGREWHQRHFIAWLLGLRIGDPAGAVAARVRQAPRSNRGPARDMRQ